MFRACAEIIRAKLKAYAAKPKRTRLSSASPNVLPAMVVQKAARTSNVTLAEASLSSALIRRQMASRQKARPTVELARTN